VVTTWSKLLPITKVIHQDIHAVNIVDEVCIPCTKLYQYHIAASRSIITGARECRAKRVDQLGDELCATHALICTRSALSAGDNVAKEGLARW
jgi:hypothetical protein